MMNKQLKLAGLLIGLQCLLFQEAVAQFSVEQSLPDTTVVEDFQAFAINLDEVFKSESDPIQSYVVEGDNILKAEIDADTLQLSALANLSGIDTLIVRAITQGNRFLADTMVVTVTPVNDIPAITSPYVNDSLSADINGVILDLRSLFEDVETADDKLEFEVSAGEGLKFENKDGQLAVNLSDRWLGRDTLLLTAYDEDSASATYQLFLYAETGPELGIAQGFSPNGDGLNETFLVKGAITPMELSVYDRWGKEVYQSADYQNDWTGIGPDGKELPDGSYYFVLKANERTVMNYCELRR